MEGEAGRTGGSPVLEVWPLGRKRWETQKRREQAPPLGTEGLLGRFCNPCNHSLLAAAFSFSVLSYFPAVRKGQLSFVDKEETHRTCGVISLIFNPFPNPAWRQVRHHQKLFG